MTASDPASDQAHAWGAAMVAPNVVRFRIWAPGMTSLALRIGGGDLAMSRDEDGWFERVESRIEPGTPYAFVTPEGKVLPDPASGAQVGDVHGPSLVCDPQAYRWEVEDWGGRPWAEAVIYELHIGTFTPEGSFRAAIGRLPYLAELGVTVIEIMPVAQFSGNRGWGYDGVLLYAPHNAYGAPDDLKALVDAAHAQGLMVLLDVVFNHFGPDGNYLPLLAPDFFDPERHTPWGNAIAYDRQPVRQFFLENAVYWLDEFRFDGLRFDAIDQIRDPNSQTEILLEIAHDIRARFPDRHIHLVTEDNRNVAYLHERDAQGKAARFTGEWNDDFHNAAHVVASGETDGYYEDYAAKPAALISRSLAEGYAYQGEASRHADGKTRGQPSRHLPPTAFIDFLQNHDQVGNRAFGERLVSLAEDPMLRLLAAILLLSPHIPMLFMGEERGETRPFLFFTDFHGELADAVRQGRRREFAKFAAFAGAGQRRAIPDPNAVSTFEACKLDWDVGEDGASAEWLALTRSLLSLRRHFIVPLLYEAGGNAGRVHLGDEGVVAVDWTFGGVTLQLRANLDRAMRAAPPIVGEIIYAAPDTAAQGMIAGALPGRSMAVALHGRAGDDRP